MQEKSNIKEYLTPKQVELYERNNLIVAEFEKRKGRKMVVAGSLAEDFGLSLVMVRHILRKANKIGRKTDASDEL